MPDNKTFDQLAADARRLRKEFDDLIEVLDGMAEKKPTAVTYEEVVAARDGARRIEQSLDRDICHDLFRAYFKANKKKDKL